MFGLALLWFADMHSFPQWDFVKMFFFSENKSLIFFHVKSSMSLHISGWRLENGWLWKHILIYDPSEVLLGATFAMSPAARGMNLHSIGGFGRVFHVKDFAKIAWGEVQGTGTSERQTFFQCVVLGKLLCIVLSVTSFRETQASAKNEEKWGAVGSKPGQTSKILLQLRFCCSPRKLPTHSSMSDTLIILKQLLEGLGLEKQIAVWGRVHRPRKTDK